MIEVMPINFLHRSASEQRNIIYSYMGYLKIAPPELQIKSISKKADISEYLESIQADMEQETDERCRMLQQDYANLIRTVGYREAITRRFFLVFQVDSKRKTEKEAVSQLNAYAQTAKKYLYQCGNEIELSENPTEETAQMLYLLLNRKSSTVMSFSQRLNQVVDFYIRENGEESVGRIPITEFIAPRELDFRHGTYVKMDGVCHSYLFIPSARYRMQVPAGWMSLLVNAGEGIDVDLFLYKQDKAKTVERIGRRIRLNRSKLKDASDTNTDFDDLAESIQAGYYLKNGLAANEEFYYVCILITITGYSPKEAEWRAKEMRKLLNAQDMEAVSCIFKEEQAFFSALPPGLSGTPQQNGNKADSARRSGPPLSPVIGFQTGSWPFCCPGSLLRSLLVNIWAGCCLGAGQWPYISGWLPCCSFFFLQPTGPFLPLCVQAAPWSAFYPRPPMAWPASWKWPLK